MWSNAIVSSITKRRSTRRTSRNGRTSISPRRDRSATAWLWVPITAARPCSCNSLSKIRMPWSAVSTYRKSLSPWEERVCAENPHVYYAPGDADGQQARFPSPTRNHRQLPLTSTVDALILDFLGSVASMDRKYSDAIEAWRTSCPKLPVWEEANEHGLIARTRVNGDATVCITPAGVALLERFGRMPLQVPDKALRRRQ
jgi:hypothetical protein